LPKVSPLLPHLLRPWKASLECSIKALKLRLPNLQRSRIQTVVLKIERPKVMLQTARKQMESNTTQWANINFQKMHTRDKTEQFMMDQKIPRRDMMIQVIGKKDKWKEVMTMGKGGEDLEEEVLHAVGPEEAGVEDLEAPEVDLAAEAR